MGWGLEGIHGRTHVRSHIRLRIAVTPYETTHVRLDAYQRHILGGMFECRKKGYIS